MKFYIKLILNILIASILISNANASNIAGEEPGINPYRELHSTGGVDNVDPQTGMPKIQHLDLFLPGNGGLDIKVQRTYDTAADTGEAIGESLGRKWSFHFGRLTSVENELDYDWCKSPEYFISPAFGNANSRPKFELPDGSTQTFVRAEKNFPSNSGFLGVHNGNTGLTPFGSLVSYTSDKTKLYVSKDRWIAKCNNESDSGGLIIYSPDGTRYDVTERESRTKNIWYIKKITDRNNNSLSFSYTKTAPRYTYSQEVTPLYLNTIRASDGRVVNFDYYPLYSYNLSSTRNSALSNNKLENKEITCYSQKSCTKKTKFSSSTEREKEQNSEENTQANTHSTRPAQVTGRRISTTRVGYPQRITEVYKRLKTISANGHINTPKYQIIGECLQV